MKTQEYIVNNINETNANIVHNQLMTKSYIQNHLQNQSYPSINERLIKLETYQKALKKIM